MIALCLISSILGGMISLGLAPYVYPQKQSLIQTTASSYAPIVSTGSSQTTFPVEQIAKTVGPAVVGVTNLSTSQGFYFGNRSLQTSASGSGFIIDAQKGYNKSSNQPKS
jgi:serine protease Do